MRKAGGRRKNLECPGCAKAYSSVVSLQEHIRRAHPDVSNELHNIVKVREYPTVLYAVLVSSKI